MGRTVNQVSLKDLQPKTENWLIKIPDSVKGRELRIEKKDERR